MDEQCAWIRSRRKRRLRITAAILAFCLLVTTNPNILETISVFAAGSRGDGGVMSITGFVNLPEETAQQTVPVGTEFSELELPDTLEAYVTVEAEDDTEDEEKPDDGDQNKDDDEDSDDSDQNKGGQENPDEGDNENSGGVEDPADDNETGEGEGDENGGSTDTNVSTDTDSAANTKSSDFGIQTGSFVMPVYMSENPQDVLTVESLTDNADTTGMTVTTDEQADTADYAEENTATENKKAEDTIAQNTTTETINIENITWESSPAYDGDVEGVYLFTPVLPESYALADGVSLPEITVEVVFQGQELTPEQYERMMEGLQDYPELLTEEDILEEDPSLAAQAAGGPRRAAARAAVQTHPGTYLTTTDNENNAGTGKADSDMDVYLFSDKSSHPIEANIFIPEGRLPTQNCYIAVRTYDVNWRGLGAKYVEYDKLFINDVRIGTLTGLDYDWNTSYYRVPLSCLQEGNNTVRIEIWDCLDGSRFWDDDPVLVQDKNWAVNIDWMQLVCDGGSREGIETFSLTLTDAAKSGAQVLIKAETEIKSADTNATYDTEYSITDSKGFIVGSYQEAGVKGGTQKFTITMPANSKDDTYTVQGILKRRSDGMVLATDSMDFEFKNGEVLLGPKLTHTISPETWTNGNVLVIPKVENAAGCTNITFSPTSRTATANGSYDFTVTYKLPSGVQRTKTYTAEVTNIDKEKPQIDYNQITVEPDATQAQMKTAMDAALTVTDNMTKKCTVTYTYPTEAQLLANEGGQVTVKVTAKDDVGNETTKDCVVLVATSPLAFSLPTATRQGTTMTFTLSAKLTATGGKTITESGFVWGTMASPTVTLNQGSAKTASPVTKRNTAFSVQAANIVEGVNYYARAYVKAGNVYYYSQPVGFNVGAKQYGTFTIKNNNNNTFTVTRTGGSEGAQTVYYRTVNGSAVGGTHFAHQASSLNFVAGETTKTITVTELGVNAAYGGKPATAYTNADRTYQVEIYRVTGGAILGNAAQTIATRTMTKGSSYTIDRTVYTTEKSKTEVADTSGKNGKRIADTTGSQGGKQENVSFLTNRYKETNYNTNSSLSTYYTNANQRTYLSNTASGWYYRYVLKAYEDVDGYEYVYFGKKALQDKHYGLDGGNKGAAISGIDGQLWMCNFLQAAKNDAKYYNFPDTRTGGGEGSGYPYKSSGTTVSYNSKTYVDLGVGDTCYLYFGATGADSDVWYVDGLTGYAIVYDKAEPKVIGVAPMPSVTYKPGDQVTISLVFDEIVDSQNSTASGLKSLVAKTNWGDFTYAGGADTNVLYFTGTVPASGASGTITVSSITNASKIKDMCDTSGTASSGSGNVSVTVDTKTPTVSITNTSLTNGTASGKISATNADTLQYAWSQSTTLPVTGWFTCNSGATVSTRQTSGTWYLHALATYNTTGATAHAYHAFDFGTPSNPASPIPELTATVNNTSWTNGSRTINITRKPAGATVKVTTPSGTTSTLSSTAATYAAQSNGLYTFTLTSGTETVVQDVVVEKIDKTKPTVAITEARTVDASAASPVYHTLTMAAQAEDVGTASEKASGIKTVQYAFSTLTSAPTSTSAWTTAGTSDKLADGRYSFSYTATQTAQTTIYLYVKVTDNAGNITTVKSASYIVIKEPAATGMPAITLSGGSTTWTKGDVTLTWKLTKTGAGSCTVDAGGERLENQPVNATGTFQVEKNGVYMVSVVDKNGDSASASKLVNNIDKDAPELETLTVSPTGYAANKTVTLTGITDDLTALYGEKGVTGRSGSGIAKREYRLDGSWTAFTGNSFTVSKNGTYTVRLTDNAANSAEYTVEVTGIDATAPKVTCTVNATPNAKSGWYTASTVPVILTFADEAGTEGGTPSGIQSVQYARVTDNTTKPTSGLSSLGTSAITSGTYTYNITSSYNGSYYLYYKVTDKKGNVADGFSDLIQKDSYTGSSGGITGPSTGQPVSTGLAMNIKFYYGPAGGYLTGGTTAASAERIATMNQHATGTQSVDAAYTAKTTGTNYFRYYRYAVNGATGTTYSYWTFYVRQVDFNTQGGSNVGSQLIWTTQSSSSTSTTVQCQVTEPPAPTRTGYTFGGWYTDAACTAGKEFDFDTQVRANTTLYAKWTANTYNVTYHLTNSDGSAYMPDAAVRTYTYGQGLTLPVPASAKEGFTFYGWYDNAGYTGTAYTSIAKTATGDKAYYAYFKDMQAPQITDTELVNATDENAEGGWYRSGAGNGSAAIAINGCSDNDAVQSVSVRVDDQPYTGTGISMPSAGTYQYALQEGEHSYTFKLADAEGNETVWEKKTVKYDGTKPVIGEITCEKKVSGFLDWIIGKESLIVHIPVSDSLSGLKSLTYMETAISGTGETTETKTVSFSGKTGEQTVDLKFNADWKGKISDIVCTDRAGNVSDSKTVGTSGGIIVEDNAPVITIMEADMTDASDPKPGNAVSGDYYEEDSAPTLYVSVQDEGAESMGISAGIEKITYAINGEEQEVTGDFADTLTGSCGFTVPLTDYTGVINVTVKAVDHAGNTATEKVIVKIRGKEKAPNAKPDYPKDALGSLSPDSVYVLTVPRDDNSTEEYTCTTDGNGYIPFILQDGTELCGKTITIIKKGDGENTQDSQPQNDLVIAARPPAPTGDVTPELAEGMDDAVINITVDAQYKGMEKEYRTEDEGTWIDVPEDDIIKDLAPGVVEIRLKATETAPHGLTGQIPVSQSANKIRVVFALNYEDTEGAHDVQPNRTGKDALTKPADPEREGFDFTGWYKSDACEKQDKWRFETTEDGEQNLVRDIVDKTKDNYKTNYTVTDGMITVTLYAGWRENVAPKLNAVLTDGSESSDGSNEKDQTKWHTNLSIVITYSDNVEVTKLYVKKDSGEYIELAADSAEQITETDADGYTQYHLNFNDIEEGEHTYAFKAVDAAGNETETDDVTAKLDTKRPELGEASFNEGYKNLWDWIIRRDSLIITIPVTEESSGIATVEYELVPTGGGTGEASDVTTGNAEVKKASGSDGSYTATINIAPDFKGQVKIVAKDNAGNISSAKTIGTDGNGIAGVIVEDNAPEITILADRGVNDEAATQANGIALSDGDYYDTAPKLIVKVEDEETSDGKAVTAGISSIAWQINDGAWNPVSADFVSNIKTSHSFMINELEGQIGVFNVTVKAVDQAGNETVESAAVGVKEREPVPKPTIDYIQEKLTGLTAGAEYGVEGEIITADDRGCIDIREEWFGSSIQMYTKGKEGRTLDSENAQITLAARPEAPHVIKKSDETIKGKSDGVLTGADTTMEYIADDGETWTAVKTGDIVNGDMTGLSSGELRIRVRATTTAPHGEYAEVEIREGITLTVTFKTNGGSSLAPVTGKSWNDTLARPEAPVKEGYALEGWYKEAELINIWNFEGETDADCLNEENGITADNTGITLYAKWKDSAKPNHSAVLADDNGERDVKNWYQKLFVILTYSDNVGVTKLYVKKDDGTYTEFAAEGTGGMIDGSAANGKDAAGNAQYQYIYNDLEEGEHIYTFKAVDAAGNETETDILTAKLDWTKPMLGKTSFSEGHKNLWDWIIRRESLIITIPVTEAGSGIETVDYTLTPVDGQSGNAGNSTGGNGADGAEDITTGAATVKKVSNSSNEYTATITIASEFKGTITVEAKDNAGNTSDTKTIGADGGGIKGVIVEDNAPKISCFVGEFTLSEHYYDEAPELTVYVADDTGEYEETVLTGGIASVTYQVSSGSAKAVDHDYTSNIVTSDSFTIPAAEIPGGVTNITVTATDHAGNQAVQSIIVRVKALEETPNAQIGYRAEKLTGLVANAVYLIDGAGMIADANGTIAIEENWMPATLSIMKLGDNSTTYNSETQNLPVPARPEAPTVSGNNETYPGAGDGVLTGLRAKTAYEISNDDGSTWMDADLNGTEIRGLAAGTYQVRTKAVEGVNFKSRATEATVGTIPATPYETPNAQIDYRKETLTGLVPNAEYIVEYGDETEEDEGNEEENEEETLIFNADADGNITIDETWFGMTLSIVRKGNGKEMSDSEAQSLQIPTRPQTPSPSGADETGLDRKDGKLTGLTANIAYDISTDGGKTWVSRTADADGEIKGVDTPASYIVRVGDTDSNFVSLPSESVMVDVYKIMVTFIANGEIYKTVRVYYGEELKEIPSVPEKKDAGDRIYVSEWCSDEQGTPAVFTNITADMTVYAVYTAYYAVTLEGDTGYTLTAAFGSTGADEAGSNISPVIEGGSFTFKFALADGYEKTDSFAVKVNGVAVELTADDTYTITNIKEDKTVTVEGVKKKVGSGKPGGGTKPSDDTDPGSGTNPGGDTEPGNSTKPGDDTKPGDGTNPEDGVPPISDDVPIGPGIIKDGKIVIDGGNIIGGGNTGDGGGITTGNLPGMAGAGSAPASGTTGESTASTILKIGDGAVIVTVVCNGRNCTAGVADTVAVANAVLTPEQIQLINDGETIEIRIDVKDISGSVPKQDQEIIEGAIEAYQKELPGIRLGMYIDISMFIRVGEGEWNAVTSTEEPIEVIIGIPEELREDGREFYIIRSHEGEYTLLNDMDNAPGTFTISTDMFSAYAIAYRQTDTDHAQGGNMKCGLCHICPTFLGICCFIWLAIIAAVIIVVVIVILRRKKGTGKIL